MAFPFMHKSVFAAPLAMALMAAPALAQDEPAVSDFNAKIGPFGGYHDQRDLDGDFFGGAEASVVAPLGHSFGAQVEGAAGYMHNDFLGGGGLHLFWRDPSIALLGVYGVYGTANDVDLGKIGPEAELYVGPILARTWLGYQAGDSQGDEASSVS